MADFSSKLIRVCTSFRSATASTPGVSSLGASAGGITWFSGVAAWSLTLCHRVRRRLCCWILLLLHRGLVLCQKREPSTPLIPTTVATKIKSWTVPATQHDVPVWSKLVTKFPQWNHAIRITGIGLLLLPARCSCLGRVGLKGNKVLLELTLCCLPVECKQSYSRHQVNTKLTFNNVVINTYIYIWIMFDLKK